ncbi:MAG: 50S ribosomal protein L32 [Candidatus Andersenbacteria bacterium]
MAVPKRKTSKSKKGRRRSHHFVTASVFRNCPKCNSPIPSHTACPTCGTYKGRDVINVMKKVGKKHTHA